MIHTAVCTVQLFEMTSSLPTYDRNFFFIDLGAKKVTFSHLLNLIRKDQI